MLTVNDPGTLPAFGETVNQPQHPLEIEVEADTAAAVPDRFTVRVTVAGVLESTVSAIEEGLAVNGAVLPQPAPKLTVIDTVTLLFGPAICIEANCVEPNGIVNGFTLTLRNEVTEVLLRVGEMNNQFTEGVTVKFTSPPVAEIPTVWTTGALPCWGIQNVN